MVKKIIFSVDLSYDDLKLLCRCVETSVMSEEEKTALLRSIEPYCYMASRDAIIKDKVPF